MAIATKATPTFYTSQQLVAYLANFQGTEINFPAGITIEFADHYEIDGTHLGWTGETK
jgi:hypothetical protein